MPSILSNSSKFLPLEIEINFEEDFKYFEISLAFSNPICLIPRE